MRKATDPNRATLKDLLKREHEIASKIDSCTCIFKLHEINTSLTAIRLKIEATKNRINKRKSECLESYCAPQNLKCY